MEFWVFQSQFRSALGARTAVPLHAEQGSRGASHTLTKVLANASMYREIGKDLTMFAQGETGEAMKRAEEW